MTAAAAAAAGLPNVGSCVAEFYENIIPHLSRETLYGHFRMSRKPMQVSFSYPSIHFSLSDNFLAQNFGVRVGAAEGIKMASIKKLTSDSNDATS